VAILTAGLQFDLTSARTSNGYAAGLLKSEENRSASTQKRPFFAEFLATARESASVDEHCGRLAWLSCLSLDLPVQVVQS
jgi:hypothetical protein